MIYCISDIHGRIDLFEKMLEQINLKTGDMLYVLGDCIDRGGGLSVLKKIMQLHDEGMATLIRGNHELMFLNIILRHIDTKGLTKILNMIQEIDNNSESLSVEIDKCKNQKTITSSLDRLNMSLRRLSLIQEKNKLCDVINCSINYTDICSNADEWETFRDFGELTDNEKVELIRFIQNSPSEIKLRIKNKHYLLIHGGLGKDEIDSVLIREDFYLNPVNKKRLKELKSNKKTIVIFGHTTTRDINIENNHNYIAPHRIWYDEKYKDKIGIDCGASYPNGQLGCLRLDDMMEFYVKNEWSMITPLSKINSIFRMEEKHEKQG